MASRRISTTNRTPAAGFTLIEILIVLGLIALVGSAVLFINLDSYRGDSFRAERTTVVTLLGQARIDALNNMSEEPHGVAFFPDGYPDSYVLFAGDSYDTSLPSTRVPYKAAYSIALGAGSPSEVVFEQLNGDSNFSGTLTLKDTQRDFSYDILINSEGGLSW